MIPIKNFDKVEVLALDFETKTGDENAGDMELFSVGAKIGEKYIGEAYTPDVFEEFWERNKNKKIVFHNAKFDLAVIRRLEHDIHKIDFEDTLIMAHLTDEQRRKGLKDLRVSELGLPQRTQWKGVNREDQDEYKEYAKDDALDTIKLYELLAPQIKAENLETVYDLERAVVFPTMEMEIHGVKLDVPLLDDQREMVAKYIEDSQAEIFDTIGYEINLASTKQLQELFFEVLEYPPRPEWETKTGYSTDANTLAFISTDRGYPRSKKVAEQLLKHRMFSKIMSAFINNLSERVDLRTSYVYPHFNAVGTVSGRFSGSQPNLQQISRDPFEEGNWRTNLRSLFTCEDDEYIITADYSQIELRVMAELSRDKNLMKCYLKNMDIHQMTADSLHLDRQFSKTLNFGIGYGLSAGGFARLTGMSFKKAQSYVDGFWMQYPGLRSFFASVVKQATQLGYIRTMSGRKRRIDAKAYGPDRQATNSIIQGSAADVMKAAMVKTYQWLDHAKSAFIMTVHDEISLVADRDYAEEAKEILQYCMEHCVNSTVPFLANISIGRRWSENK